jgi:hypothetical protein
MLEFDKYASIGREFIFSPEDCVKETPVVPDSEQNCDSCNKYRVGSDEYQA